MTQILEPQAFGSSTSVETLVDTKSKMSAMDPFKIILELVLFCFRYLAVLIFTLYSYFEFIYYRYIVTNSKSLSTEIVVVTGSGRGIGREICLELARKGATVICWSRTAKPNEAVLQKIKNRGGRAYAYTVDVSNRIQVEEMAQRVGREVGQVSMVINNAGLMRILPFMETPPEDIESMFRVNVLSNFWVLRAFLPGMIERKKGHVVSVCSASGILPTRFIVAYSATKHAVQGYIDALRDEIGHHPLKPQIKFTTAYPFYCRTEMLDDGVPHSRFPFLFPIVTPELVAQKVVEGIQREVDYIYIPALIGWLAMFSWLVTPRAATAHGDFLEVHIDPIEKKRS